MNFCDIAKFDFLTVVTSANLFLFSMLAFLEMLWGETKSLNDNYKKYKFWSTRGHLIQVIGHWGELRV